MRRLGGVIIGLVFVFVGGSIAFGTDDLGAKEDLRETPSSTSPLFVEGDDGLYRDCSSIISVQVDQLGLFNMGSGTDEACQPVDGAWDLMYRWPSSPWSSYTTARVDGVDHRLGIDVAPSDVIADPQSVSHFYDVGGIRIAQTLSLDHAATQEGDFNTTRIRYRILNPESQSHEVALRVMIDTELNYNDGAPFQIPGSGGITTEAQFIGSAIPGYMLAFEDFADPVHIGAASFDLLESLPPDRLVLARWPSLWSSPFDYAIDADASITGDSAFAVYYEAPNGVLTQNQSMDVAFRYGRTDVSSDLLPPLGLSVAGPAAVESGGSFTVTGFVTNLGAGTGANVSTELALPTGMVTAEPSRQLGDLDPGETVQVTWEVSVSPSITLGTHEYSVAVGADDIPPKAVSRSIEVEPSVDKTGVVPLLGAHGITGTAADMLDALDIAVDAVTPLGLDDVDSSPTGETSSVWMNGQTIAETATQLLAHTGAERARIIAHSKGGLDSRAAMTLRPELFADLGMLATPNGGSALADALCLMRQLPASHPLRHVKPSMGPCDDASDGLYNLQTWWVQDVFNPEVDRTPRHDFYVASGDCIGPEGSIGCQATGLLGHDCADVDGDNDGDGDSVVCVDSAWNQTPLFDGGRHQPVFPIYTGLGHGQMREDPCPITGVLARLYPNDIDLGAVNDFCPGSISSLSQASPAAEPDSGSPFQLGEVTVVELAEDGRAEMPIAAEGSPAVGVVLFAEPEEVSTVEYHTSGGQTLTPDTESVDLLFESPIPTYSFANGGEDGTLVLQGEPGAAVGVAIGIRSDVDMTVAVSPEETEQVRIDVTLRGAAPSTADDEQVRVVIPGETRTEVGLTVDQVTGDEIVYSGVVTVPTGRSTPIHVFASGPINRVVSTGIVLPDHLGSLDGITGQALVDVDGDGVDDALDVDIAVTTSTPGEHNVSFDLETDGTMVAGAYGSGTLDVGQGTVTVRLWLDDLAAAGKQGPFQVVDALLTRDVDHAWVDQVASLGTIDAVPLEVLGGGDLRVSRPAAVSIDTDNDGFFDLMRWEWLGWIPDAGDYIVSGTLLGPDGSRVESFEKIAGLDEGLVTLGHDFDGTVVGSTGNGRYSLIGLRLERAGDASVFADAPDGWTDVLMSSEWIGGTPNIQTLIRYWNQAEADGLIENHGFYTSQRLRLARVRDHLDAGDVAKATSELEKFRDQVEAAMPGMIEQDTSFRIISYTEALIAELE